MTALQIASLIVLAAAFFAATKWRLSLGILLLPAAFVVGTIGGLSTDDIVAGFPTEMFLLLVGLTFMFTVVKVSGTMEYVMDRLLRLVGDRVVIVPFVLFISAALVTGAGTYAVATLALLIPIGMRFARQTGISVFMMALMIVHGALAGLFSPIAIDGVFTDGLLTDAGLPSRPVQLFLSHVAVHAVLCVAAFLLFGGLTLFRRRGAVDDLGAPPDPGGGGETLSAGGGSTQVEPGRATTLVPTAAPARPSLYQMCTMVAIVLLLVSAIATDLDLGFVALTLGVVLAVIFERNGEDLVVAMPWTVMVLIGGVLSFIAVMTEIGTLDAIGAALTSFEQPEIGVLLLSFVTAITSAFTSTIGVLGASLPLGIPMVEAGLTNLSVVGPVTISATVVDASPMGIGGALVLACAEPEERAMMFRRMAIWGFSMVLIGPVLSWTIFTLL